MKQSGARVSIVDGTIQYTPDNSVLLPDALTYSVSDGLGATGTATAIIDFVHTDSSPNASADAYNVFYDEVEEDKVRSFVLPVLNNDFAASGQGQLRITGVGINETNQSNASDQQGQVVIDGSNLVYTPALQENLQEGSHFIEKFLMFLEIRVTDELKSRLQYRASPSKRSVRLRPMPITSPLPQIQKPMSLMCSPMMGLNRRMLPHGRLQEQLQSASSLSEEVREEKHCLRWNSSLHASEWVRGNRAFRV